MTSRTCDACGHVSDADVRAKVVFDQEAPPGQQYTSEWRCSDVRACRDRVSQQNEAER